MNRPDPKSLSQAQFLSQYRAGDYPRPSVAVDMVIFTVDTVPDASYRKLAKQRLRLLLIRRGEHPYLGQWALPGGFVRPGETVGQAARRELEEETGVRGGHLEQLFTFSAPGRDPRGWVMSCAHMALVDSGQLTLAAGSDADEARWFSVGCSAGEGAHNLSLTCGDITLSAAVKPGAPGAEGEILENRGLAFDHGKIIEYALRALRAKVASSDLAFSLMPRLFTLTQLQQVYEAILDRPLYKAAFRRKIAHLVQETDQYTEDKGHRPARFYTRRQEEATP